jgi:energy-coupling factor transporter transmembrane protein EcfT
MDFALTVNETRRTIKPGSLVIVFLSHDELSYVYAVPGEILNNKWGSFHHNDLIGREFGCTWQSKFSNGWVHALSPTPELWARALNHRTQIVHELDAATVVRCTYIILLTILIITARARAFPSTTSVAQLMQSVNNVSYD